MGSVRVVRPGVAIAAAGMGAALLEGNLVWGFIGFSPGGCGLIVTSAAGHRTADRPEAGVAAISSTGYFAFLVGPPVIGFVARAATLRSALGVVVVSAPWRRYWRARSATPMYPKSRAMP